jgi:hypothetical protein
MSNSQQGRLEECPLQDDRERHVLGLYTGTFYKLLNEFMSKRDILEAYHVWPLHSVDSYVKNFYHYIVDSNSRQVNINAFSLNSDAASIVRSYWNNLKWLQIIQYRFMLELYGIITRCPLHGKQVSVFRGVRKHYLKEDPSNAYHITTFLSTSLDIRVLLRFSPVHIYIFTIMPDVQSIYIGGREDELLVNPYVLYAFVGKEDKGSYIEYHYVIFRSNVEPPDDFLSFMEFRDSINHRSEHMIGGSELVLEPLRNTNSHVRNIKPQNTRRNTVNRKSNRQKLKRMRNTNTRNRNKNKNRNNNKTTNRKMMTTHSITAADYARERMTSFIGTSTKGIPLTQEMKDVVRKLREQFNRKA